MSAASNLLERVVNEFANNGIILKNFRGWNSWRTDHEYITGDRYFVVEVTYRHNGTEEDVTVTIEVKEVGKIICEESCWLNLIAKIKVPKNASDRVISNRVKKAIEAFNNK